MPEHAGLAIIGAGPAGLAAAIEAAGLGLPVILIDAYPRPGGQYFKQLPAQFKATASKGEEHPGDEGQELLSRLALVREDTGFSPPSYDQMTRPTGWDNESRPADWDNVSQPAGVHVLSETVVWGIFPNEEGSGYLLCLYGPEGTARRLHAKKVVVAPGAYDRPVPFPGWTLPGVMTAGAAQILVKSQRVLPGQRVLLSGTGPLQLAVASQLINVGAEVVSILDANRFPWSGWKHTGAIWGQGQRLKEGWEYWRTIRRAGVSLRWGQTVVCAEGDGRVEQAVIGPVSGGAHESVPVDTICLGYGFVPAVQLPAQAGCELDYQSELGSGNPSLAGCYVPRRDESLQTSLPGLFVAGDGAGIGGKDVALCEGRLAAMAAASQLGHAVAVDKIGETRRELARQKRFAATLDALFPFPPVIWDLMTEDTVLCRCEEITMGEVRQAVAGGATTPNAVKSLTRAGMGRCQGRMCYAAVAHLVAQETGQPVETVGTLTPRPPIVPVPLEGLLEEVL